MKLRKNPLGEYVGKIGNTVGGKWKSVYWVRTLVFPTQRGTVEKYRLLKQGIIAPETFSFKQMNIRRLSLGPLGWIAENNLESLIHPVWEKAVRRTHMGISGMNLFIRKSANILYKSIPHMDQEYDPVDNAPDLKTIQMSTGILEPTSEVNGATYNTLTGILHVDWKTETFTNGKSDDYAYIVALKKPILEGEDDLLNSTWKPQLFMYGEAKLPTPPALPRERGHASMEITIPTGLTATDLVAFAFFRDKEGIIGFSPSKAKDVTAAA